MVAATTHKVLVIGSQTTARSGAYQSLVAGHQSAQGDDLVRAEMLDRVIDGAALLEADHFDKAVVNIAEHELQTHMQTLLGAVAPSLQSGAQLELLNLHSKDQQTACTDQLNALGYSDAQVSGSSIIARKTQTPQLAQQTAPTKAVPLRLLRNKPSAKKASLWATTPAPANVPTIDESTLLSSEDLKRKEAIQRPDCDVKRTRKACKNCTCGLREILLEEADDLPANMQTGGDVNGTTQGASGKKVVSTGAATSSCGNCYLGDAFRCASCPYLGLPAFEPGQKVDLTSFGDDI